MELLINHENIASVLEGLESDMCYCVSEISNIKEKLKTAIEKEEFLELLEKVKTSYTIYIREFDTVELAVDSFDKKQAIDNVLKLTGLKALECKLTFAADFKPPRIDGRSASFSLRRYVDKKPSYLRVDIVFDIALDKKGLAETLELVEKHSAVLDENIRALYKNKHIVENVKSFSVKISY